MIAQSRPNAKYFLEVIATEQNSEKQQEDLKR